MFLRLGVEYVRKTYDIFFAVLI